MRKAFQAVAALAVAVTVLFVCPARGQDKASIWMKQKRELTQNVLAGLTEGDFDKINANAAAMNFLGYLEKWARAGQPEYKQQTTYFAFANRELIRHAKEKNIDGATLAFNQLTTSCVQCHKIVRDPKK
jgi:hypothetical protein